MFDKPHEKPLPSVVVLCASISTDYTRNNNTLKCINIMNIFFFTTRTGFESLGRVKKESYFPYELSIVPKIQRLTVNRIKTYWYLENVHRAVHTESKVSYGLRHKLPLSNKEICLITTFVRSCPEYGWESVCFIFDSLDEQKYSTCRNWVF